MNVRRSFGAASLIVGALALAAAGCGRGCSRSKEVNDIAVSVTANRVQVPIESALEVTYTWTTGPAMKKLDKDYRAMVHFLDPKGNLLFAADHVPQPPTTLWEPGKTYTYTRTVFVPTFPYIGPVDIRMGLYPEGKGSALASRVRTRAFVSTSPAVSSSSIAPRTSSLSTRTGGTAPRHRPTTRASSARGPSATPSCP